MSSIASWARALAFAALGPAGLILVALVIGLLDVPIRRRLFERDHKMAVPELKREMTKCFSPPEQRQAHALAEGPPDRAVLRDTHGGVAAAPAPAGVR